MKVMEMFMLAAVNTKTGGLYYGSYLGYGLSGIAVIELVRQGRLVLEDQKIIVKDSSSTGDDLLDEVLQAIDSKSAPKKVGSWVTSLPYKVKRFSRRVMERLEDNGFLRIEQSRFLLLFPYRKYIVTNESERDRIVNACREALLNGGKAPGQDIMLILSIAAANYFVGKLFTGEERKGLKETFKQLKKGAYFQMESDDMRQVVVAVQRAIAAVQAAAAATV